MAAVTIGIADVKDTKKRMRRAFAGHNEGAFIGFASVELMWKVITPKRWELMRAIAGAVELTEGAHFMRQRRMIRDALAADGIAARIDALVTRLLGG